MYDFDVMKCGVKFEGFFSFCPEKQRPHKSGESEDRMLLMSLWFCLLITQSNIAHYNMTVWILARNCIGITIAVGLIRLHMLDVKKSRV